MPSVKIGPQFFKKELHVYSDVFLAFVREMIQNAVDSQAQNIAISISPTDNPDVTVFEINDDGCGMDRNTLENVYFVLGETSKNTPYSVGGFGKARILTCFSQKSYELWTNNLYVYGIGADYQIVEEVQTNKKGVRIRVLVETNGHNLLSICEAYLAKCNIRATVTLNNNRWGKWTYCRNHKRDLSVGKIYTNNSQFPELLVRVDGTLMYCRTLQTKCQVILELQQNKSRDTLLSNRDGMVMEKQRELDSFISELNVNKKSALRRHQSQSSLFKGTGTFVSRRKSKVEPISERVDSRELESVGASAIGAGVTDYHSRGAYVAENTVYNDRRDDIFTVNIWDETSNERVRKVIPSYNPINWDLKGETGYRWVNGKDQTFRAGIDKYKLLVLWREACECCIEYLMELIGKDEISWGIGFNFSDDFGAMHRLQDDCNFIFLNPCTDTGTMKYSISKKNDLVAMVVLAAHEVCHIVQSYHDEIYANLLTDLMKHVTINIGDILNRMKAAKMIKTSIYA